MAEESKLLEPLTDYVPSLKTALLAPEREVDLWLQSHTRLIDYHSAVSFQVQEEMPLFPRPRWASIQSVCDTRYRSEGRLRSREDHCYFCYTLEGAGEFSREGSTCRIAAGQGFLMEIDDPSICYCYPPGGREPWRFLAFTFVGLPAKAMVRALTERYGARYTLDAKAPILRRLLAQQSQEFVVASISPAEGARLVMDLLLALADVAENTEGLAPERKLVKRAMQIMEAGSDRNFQVAELAAAVGVSREHLARAFQRQLRQSPSQFLRAQKMQRACFLLKGTTQPVPQIAADLGYTDSTNFIHAFHQAIGMTPYQFRLHGRLALTTE